MIFTYSASISKVNLMRENTKVVLDSFVTQNATEIYNSIKQGNDYTEVIDTEEFCTSLISFCTLETDCCDYDNGELTEELKDEISLVDEIN